MTNSDYNIRELKTEDFNRGILDCFKELTEVGEISSDLFIQRFRKRKDLGIITAVAVENETGRILGTGSVFYEPKFIRSCATKGFIEDVCIAKYAQKRGVGRKLVEYLRDRALKDGCYKVILTCSEQNESFYEKMNFKKIEIAMAIYTSQKKQ